MIKSQNRRRNYFIKKRFQTNFILKFCLPVIFTALISAIVVYRFSSESTTTVFENSRLMIKAGTEFIIPGLMLSTLISVILVGIATALVMFFISHRIAGPLYKLENSLERLGSGDMSFDIRFRQKDEVRKLAEIFNVASLDLSKLIGDVKREHAQLNSTIKELKAMVETAPPEEEALKEVIKKLEAVNSRLNEKLFKFRLR